MATTPEGKVKSEIKSWLKTLPHCWFYMPIQNGMGVVGIPDIVGCLNGNFFAIECKAKGKESTVTPNQRLQLDGIIGANGIALVASDLQTVQVIFKVAGWWDGQVRKDQQVRGGDRVHK